MATIINNSLVAEETVLRIHQPVFYLPDPDKGKPLAFADCYFGLPGRDATLEENQKKLYVLQEDGSAVPVLQPFTLTAGGTASYQGSPVQLAVSGSYSFIAIDKGGDQVYNFASIAGINLQGFSGVIAEETQTVDGSLTLTFDKITTTTSGFYQSVDATGNTFQGKYLRKGVDYTSPTSTTITLLSATADGFVILGREMDPTGQIVPITDGGSALFVFDDIAGAVASDLQAGDTLTINGGIVAGDKLGGAKYLTVFGQPDVADGENIINLTNLNQIKAIENTFRLARYAEVTTQDASVSGALNIDLNQGNVHKITLTENVSAINFVNPNPDTSLTTTVTLKIVQDAATPRTVSFAGILWAGGSVPTMSVGLGAIDRYAFVTDDGGGTWSGVTTGQGFI